jgi:hypothetical protein
MAGRTAADRRCFARRLTGKSRSRLGEKRSRLAEKRSRLPARGTAQFAVLRSARRHIPAGTGRRRDHGDPLLKLSRCANGKGEVRIVPHLKQDASWPGLSKMLKAGQDALDHLAGPPPSCTDLTRASLRDVGQTSREGQTGSHRRISPPGCPAQGRARRVGPVKILDESLSPSLGINASFTLKHSLFQNHELC